MKITMFTHVQFFNGSLTVIGSLDIPIPSIKVMQTLPWSQKTVMHQCNDVAMRWLRTATTATLQQPQPQRQPQRHGDELPQICLSSIALSETSVTEIVIFICVFIFRLVFIFILIDIQFYIFAYIHIYIDRERERDRYIYICTYNHRYI